MLTSTKMSVKTNIDQSVCKEVLNCHLREGNMAKKQKNVILHKL